MTTTLAGIVLIGGFVLLMVLRTPVSFAMLAATLGSALVTGTNFSVMVRQMVDGANNFSLLSIPFFIVMGEFMSAGGISEKIVDLANLAVGRFRGGLAYVNVLDSMFFGGISGSAVADVSSLGTIVIPMMKKQGYDEDFAVGLTVTTACQGVLIPPSHNMVIYALAAGGVSIGTLFMAGLLPGILLGVGMIIMCIAMAKRYNFPKNEKFAGWRYVGKTALQTLPALFMPIIILGGILGGVFTPTESSVVAGVYALVVSAFILRNLTWRDVYEALVESAKMTAVVMFIIAVAAAMGWGITTMRLPQKISEWCLSFAHTKLQFMMLCFVLLVIIGMLVDVTPAILIIVPILVPAARAFGVDMLYFGLFVAMTLTMGLVTPPVGMLLFTTCTVAKIDLSAMYKSILPYALVEIIFCVLLIFAEPVLLFLPRLFGY